MIGIEILGWLGSALIIGAIVFNFSYKEIGKNKHGKNKIHI